MNKYMGKCNVKGAPSPSPPSLSRSLAPLLEARALLLWKESKAWMVRGPVHGVAGLGTAIVCSGNLVNFLEPACAVEEASPCSV